MRRPAPRLIALALASAAVAAVALGAAGCGAPYASQLTAHARLTDVAMATPTDGWAVGDAGAMLHFDGTRWRPLAAPDGTDLTGLTLGPAGAGWAVGLDLARGSGVILRKDGDGWTRVAGPSVPALRAVALDPSGEGWAVGDGGTVLREAGGRWAPFASPTSATLTSIAALAPDDLWVAGYATHNTSDGAAHTAIVAHYHGGAWALQDVQAPPAELLGITMLSPEEGWAVGRADQDPQAIILRKRGGRWIAVRSPTRYPLAGVLAAAGQQWIVGQDGTLLYNLEGRWAAVPGPTTSDLNAVAILSPDDGWAVGDNGSVLRFHGGVWIRVLPRPVHHHQRPDPHPYWG
jgi:hypothetical protein